MRQHQQQTSRQTEYEEVVSRQAAAAAAAAWEAAWVARRLRADGEAELREATAASTPSAAARLKAEGSRAVLAADYLEQLAACQRHAARLATEAMEFSATAVGEQG